MGVWRPPPPKVNANRIDWTSNVFSCPWFRGSSWSPYHFRVTSCRTGSASFPPWKSKNKDNVAKFYSIHWIERGATSSMKEYNNLKHNFTLSMIRAETKNKSWIVSEYLINNQNEKENILKIRKFILFIYLLYHWLIGFSKFR